MFRTFVSAWTGDIFLWNFLSKNSNCNQMWSACTSNIHYTGSHDHHFQVIFWTLITKIISELWPLGNNGHSFRVQRMSLYIGLALLWNGVISDLKTGTQPAQHLIDPFKKLPFVDHFWYKLQNIRPYLYDAWTLSHSQFLVKRFSTETYVDVQIYFIFFLASLSINETTNTSLSFLVIANSYFKEY